MVFSKCNGYYIIIFIPCCKKLGESKHDKELQISLQ